MNILTRTDIHNAVALNCDCISIIAINLVVLPQEHLVCTRYMDVIAYVTLFDVRDYCLSAPVRRVVYVFIGSCLHIFDNCIFVHLRIFVW